MPWHFDDGDPVVGMIREVVDSAGTNEVRSLVRLVREKLTDHALAGEGWAASVLDQCEADGINRLIARIQKQGDRSIFRDTQTAELIDAPSQYGVRIRDQNGRRTGKWQRAFWFIEPFDVALEMGEGLIRQGDKMTGRGHGIIAAVKHLREQCPQAATALQACEILGIDPRQFGIEVDAI